MPSFVGLRYGWHAYLYVISAGRAITLCGVGRIITNIVLRARGEKGSTVST